MKPDVIVCWPRNCDYPIWRQFIHENREKFNVVVVVFTETHQGEDYRDFVKEAMLKDWVLFCQSPIPNASQDWLNIAVNYGLLQSYNAPWIWFTEQDFIPNHGFWLKVYDLANSGSKAIGIKEGQRIHPASLFLTREALNGTNKDFGIVVDKSDHFSKLIQDLDTLGVTIDLVDSSNWQHMNGLSHNMSCLAQGLEVPYKPEEFKSYLTQCLQVTVPLDERFKSLATEYLKRQL